ncbi:hypothetical protein FV226_05590 [Methylobacterium sp. WL12]|uniref:hypothetical protein n=1 Tax=Methylobacterium sp. WL12 TaxID=2603890 RepID=UPI0011CA49D8|nr:hypothetical protein [Methylobacterium sp. WL12]TXM74844.1 hypothetical protein FV226_05590 [Methylobacterium sp. WL12]
MTARGRLRAAVAAIPLRTDPGAVRDGAIVRDRTGPGQAPRTYLVRVHDGEAFFVPFVPELRKDPRR